MKNLFLTSIPNLYSMYPAGLNLKNNKELPNSSLAGVGWLKVHNIFVNLRSRILIQEHNKGLEKNKERDM